MRSSALANYGPCVEDFVPYSDDRALVTAGLSYRDLNFILDVRYGFTGELVLDEPIILETGSYLRLGHWNGGLVFSEGWEGPHQPFRHETGLYYSDDAPTARLYRDGEVLIDHWDGVPELGNPWVDESLWFEARDNGKAPEGWSIYRADLDGGNIERVCEGANPCVYKGFLYYGLWNGRNFDIGVHPYPEDRGIDVPQDSRAELQANLRR